MSYEFPTAMPHWGDEERAAIARVVDSGQFTTGPEVGAFEKEIADYHGRRFAIMVNSGSSANIVAVAALFHKEKRPLRRSMAAVVPAFAWATTWAPLIQHGLELYLLDADDSWNPDPGVFDDWWGAINPKLIIATSMLGVPAQLARIQDYADKIGAYFINDNCESLGALTDERLQCGSYGLMSTTSLYWSHQLSAIEGGVILTDDEECARLCRLLRNHGWTRGTDPIDGFDDEIKFVLPGYNLRGLEMHAAVAREQLKKLNKGAGERITNFLNFRDQVRKLDNHLIKLPDVGLTSNPFGIHMRFGDNATRNHVAASLRANGIDCRMPAGGSLRLQPIGSRWGAQQTPRADEIHRNGLMIGNAPFPIPDKIEKAAKVIREALA